MCSTEVKSVIPDESEASSEKAGVSLRRERLNESVLRFMLRFIKEIQQLPTKVETTSLPLD
jgi:hypothetical protein